MRLVIYIMMLGMLGTASLAAQTTDDVVVAKVNNQTIYKSGIDIIIKDLKQAGTNIDAKNRQTLIERLVEQKLVAQYARKKGYDTHDDVKKQIEVMTEMVLRDRYLSDLVHEKVNQNTIKAEFDKKMAAFKPKFEYKASHILVDSQDKAQQVKSELDKGALFADVAQKYSSDSNAQSGGDLGYFSAEMMVKPFSDAVSELSVGKISLPVQTDFGWHIIQLTDKRELPKPTLEQLTPQIEAQLSRLVMSEHIAELKKQSDIKIYSSQDNH